MTVTRQWAIETIVKAVGVAAAGDAADCFRGERRDHNRRKGLPGLPA
jgi:hypothetical protein